jgi:hypothetical protein
MAPPEQDNLIMEYMAALFDRSLNYDALELPTSGVKNGFQLVATIDLQAIMLEQKPVTRYEAMIVLHTNIHLLSNNDLGERLTNAVLAVSRKMLSVVTAK